MDFWDLLTFGQTVFASQLAHFCAWLWIKYHDIGIISCIQSKQPFHGTGISLEEVKSNLG